MFKEDVKKKVYKPVISLVFMKFKRGKLLGQKRGQDGPTSVVAVAILIMVMAVLIIIYILSLPPSERVRLLNITVNSTSLVVPYLFFKDKRA